jgi:hypothetical protein
MKSVVVKENEEKVDKTKMLKHLLAFIENQMKTDVPKRVPDKIVFHSKMVDCLASCLLVIHFEACSPEEIKKLMMKDLKKSIRQFFFCLPCKILIVFQTCR